MGSVGSPLSNFNNGNEDALPSSMDEMRNLRALVEESIAQRSASEHQFADRLQQIEQQLGKITSKLENISQPVPSPVVKVTRLYDNAASVEAEKIRIGNSKTESGSDEDEDSEESSVEKK